MCFLDFFRLRISCLGESFYLSLRYNLAERRNASQHPMPGSENKGCWLEKKKKKTFCISDMVDPHSEPCARLAVFYMIP